MLDLYPVGMTGIFTNMWFKLCLNKESGSITLSSFSVKKTNNKVLNRCKRFPQGDLKSARMQQSCVFHQKHHLKIASTYFLSIRTWTFLLLTRLSLLWRFWKGNSKKKNHWWERSVCLRREPLPKEENSGKTTTFSLTTSTMAFQIRPTAEAGNRHVLAVRRVHNRQHTGPMFNITPAIICFLWPGPTHVHPTGGFPFFVLRVHLVYFPESDKGKKKKSPWWERWFIMSSSLATDVDVITTKGETIWRHFHILR